VSYNTENLNEQMKKLADLQAKSLEPMRIFSGLAVDAMEQIARKNYALMGDFIEYSVKQAHLPLKSDNVGDIATAQVAEATAFTELMGNRAAEYVELANTFGQRARKAADDAAAAVKAA